MDNDLRRVFDQTRPSPAQKEAMLGRLLTLERKVKPMKKLNKLTVVGIAAALMVIACAAAVVTGIDQRLLDYFGAGPEQEELISPYAVPVDITMKDSGGTLKVRQVLVDRYTVMMLLDFTAPDGVDLSNADSFAWWDKWSWSINHCDFLDSNGAEMELGVVTCEWICLNKDTEKRCVTFLYCGYSAKGGVNEAHSVRFFASSLLDKNGRSLISGNWSCVIPVPGDSGWEATVDEVYWTEGVEERITKVYLSPMTFHVTLERDVPLDGEMDGWSFGSGPDLGHFAWLQENIILTDKNGGPVVLTNKNCRGNPQKTTFTFGLEEIIDPARFQGGTLIIMGHEISLDGLTVVGAIDFK
jgi:hypothetical protein